MTITITSNSNHPINKFEVYLEETHDLLLWTLQRFCQPHTVTYYYCYYYCYYCCYYYY